MARTVLAVPSSEYRPAAKRNPNQLDLFSSISEEESITHARKAASSISLDYTPDSFVIPESYAPPNDKRVLLAIPCAGKKPYSLSRTHSVINTKLQNAFGENRRAIHKITLSGLYGPVPEEFESEEPVVRYDFQLSPRNSAQIQLSADRFNAYLDKHGDHYDVIVGYATSQAYRMVFESIQGSKFVLRPIKPRQKRLSEFFRHAHLDELIEVLSTVIPPPN